MADKTWNKNVRFNTNSESAMQAWSLLHSDEVENGFKSQNEFIICAINDYYERYVQKKDDPYLETREKEDAFVERIISHVTKKILENLPTLSDGTLWEGQTALYFRWTCLPDCAVSELAADSQRIDRRLS